MTPSGCLKFSHPVGAVKLAELLSPYVQRELSNFMAEEIRQAIRETIQSSSFPKHHFEQTWPRRQSPPILKQQRKRGRPKKEQSHSTGATANIAEKTILKPTSCSKYLVIAFADDTRSTVEISSDDTPYARAGSVISTTGATINSSSPTGTTPASPTTPSQRIASLREENSPSQISYNIVNSSPENSSAPARAIDSAAGRTTEGSKIGSSTPPVEVDAIPAKVIISFQGENSPSKNTTHSSLENPSATARTTGLAAGGLTEGSASHNKSSSLTQPSAVHHPPRDPAAVSDSLITLASSDARGAEGPLTDPNRRPLLTTQGLSRLETTARPSFTKPSLAARPLKKYAGPLTRSRNLVDELASICPSWSDYRKMQAKKEKSIRDTYDEEEEGGWRRRWRSRRPR
ncbi:hypothetical protein TWF281_002159 [Arthrobotrys megalospora]